jgi:hypothetical protein
LKHRSEVVVGVPMTRAQKQMLEAAAQERGIATAALVRRILFNERVHYGDTLNLEQLTA